MGPQTTSTLWRMWNGCQSFYHCQCWCFIAWTKGRKQCPRWFYMYLFLFFQLQVSRFQLAVPYGHWYILTSWGPCAWVVTGELYPLRARGKALSMTTASNWLLNWALAYATPYMVDTGPGDAGLGSKVFFIWGGFCCLAATFVALFIFETKGTFFAFLSACFVILAETTQVFRSSRSMSCIWLSTKPGNLKASNHHLVLRLSKGSHHPRQSLTLRPPPSARMILKVPHLRITSKAQLNNRGKILLYGGDESYPARQFKKLKNHRPWLERIVYGILIERMRLMEIYNTRTFLVCTHVHDYWACSQYFFYRRLKV